MTQNMVFGILFVILCSGSTHAQEKYALPHGSVYSLAFSPDGKKLAVGQSDRSRSVQVWNVAKGKPLHKFGDHRNVVTALAWSADSKIVKAFCTRRYDGIYYSKAKYWNVTTGQLNKRRDVKGGGANLALSRNGRFLVTVSGFPNKIAHVWDLVNKKKTPLKADLYAHVVSAAVSEDGKWAANSDGKEVFLFELPSGKLRSRFELLKPCRTKLRYSPDGKWLACQQIHPSIVLLLDAHTGQQKAKLVFARKTGIKTRPYDVHLATDYQFSPDGKIMACVSRKGLSFWSIATLKHLRTLPFKKPLQRPLNTKLLAYAPDGRHVAVADTRGTVYVFEVPKLRP